MPHWNKQHLRYDRPRESSAFNNEYEATESNMNAVGLLNSGCLAPLGGIQLFSRFCPSGSTGVVTEYLIMYNEVDRPLGSKIVACVIDRAWPVVFEPKFIHGRTTSNVTQLSELFLLALHASRRLAMATLPPTICRG
uniref:Uncharacterized protein n=1 Tax=Timema bartmani TaxID=61472 RepID=A0A7R9HX52_9NEOP|nr:unnamed protein product [Timema bartmani]